MPTDLTFYFDFISPYAYLGWKRVGAMAAKHGRRLRAVPILFAALLDANQTKGPAEIPAKRVYIFKDTYRNAHAQGIRFGLPPAHPFNPLLALRIASLPMEDAAQHGVVDALFDAVWSGAGPGVTDPEVVAQLLSQAGFDGPALVAAANTDDAKARVRTATSEALARGVFGVPSIDADGEVFWGTDAFPHIEARLEGRDPVATLDLSQWKDLPAQAVRKGAT